MELIFTIAGAIISLAFIIIGFFLVRTIKQIDDTRKELSNTELKLAVLENDHNNKHFALGQQMSSLTDAVRENTQELKEFKEVMFRKYMD